MVTFLSKLIITPIDNNKDKWQLMNDFEVHAQDVRPKKLSVIVPKGFVTDGSSIPRIFRAYIPRFGKYTKASVVRDFLYSYKGFVFEQDGISGYYRSEVSKKETDLIFKKIMKADRVNNVKCWLLYHAVKWFGIFSWNKSKRK